MSLSHIMSPLLQHNPEFHELYHHFIHNISPRFVQFDDQYNPFRTILSQMALHSSAEHLLAVLLATSAAYRAAITAATNPQHLISNLLARCFRGLSAALDDPMEASRDITLATSLLLASYYTISSDVTHWRMHLHGARDIILHGRRTAGSSYISETIRRWLFKWFAHLDVITGTCCLTLKEPNYTSAVSLIEYVTDVKNDGTERGIGGIFDTQTGFASKLPALILRIGRLVHEKLVATHINVVLSHCQEFLAAVNQLELDLCSAEIDSVILPSDQKNVESENQLRAFNLAYFSAARLRVQRRLRDMTSEQVSASVQEIFDAVKKVPVGSGLEIALLSPLFSAGLEATGEDRDYARFRMTQMENVGLGDLQRAKRVMLQTWEHQDKNIPVLWEDILEAMGWNVSLA